MVLFVAIRGYLKKMKAASTTLTRQKYLPVTEERPIEILRYAPWDFQRERRIRQAAIGRHLHPALNHPILVGINL